MFRYQFDSDTVSHWIRLRQILHGLNEQALSFDVDKD